MTALRTSRGGQPIPSRRAHDSAANDNSPGGNKSHGSDSTLSRGAAIELFEYDHVTGVLSWRVRKGKMLPGAEVGAKQANGYLRVYVDGRSHSVHRIIWLMVHGEWPINDIDHINGTRDDNRIDNLREATRSQNLMNTRVRSDNKTGAKGVRVKRGKFQARIKVDGKEISLGVYDTVDAASAARMEAANRIHGIFARAS